ncbi:MAG: hypothetical protein HC770_03770, partial [Pseudanabaena sp. CRU_2_10]|nr:hypothetical protein [Pseudanabaena sp. CRU_2_10]
MDIKAWSITITGFTIVVGAIAYLILAQPFSKTPTKNLESSSSDTSKISPPVDKPDNSLRLKQDKLGRELFQSMLGCVRSEIAKPSQTTPEAMQATSLNCFMKVVVLDPKGKVRTDSEERLTAVVKASGISVEHPKSNGQASVPLQQLPDSSVFTLPVAIAGKSKTFLLDTGASSFNSFDYPNRSS